MASRTMADRGRDASSLWRLVAGREITQRIRSKAFVISSAVTMAAVVAGVLLSAFLQDDHSPRHVDVQVVESSAVSYSVADLEAALRQVGAVLELDVQSDPAPSRSAADDALRHGRADIVVDGTSAEWHRKVDTVEQALVQNAIQVAVRQTRARDLGLPRATFDALLAPVAVPTSTLEPADPSSGVRAATAGVGVVLLFLSIQIHGNAVLMGVVEEKSTRVVEVLLGRARPRSLLIGKVVGIGVVGITQVVLVALAALAASLAVRSVDVPKVPIDAILWFVVWFVLGFGLYATVFAGLGSLVSRQEDAQAVVTPAILPFLAAYLLSLSMVGSPDSKVARIAAIFPLTAPMTMPVRIAAGNPYWWEIAASLVALMLTIALALQFAARLYERNLLRSGARIGLFASLRNRRS
jgi:ABC-2 type transport system permease protein